MPKAVAEDITACAVEKIGLQLEAVRRAYADLDTRLAGLKGPAATVVEGEMNRLARLEEHLQRTVSEHRATSTAGAILHLMAMREVFDEIAIFAYAAAGCGSEQNQVEAFEEKFLRLAYSVLALLEVHSDRPGAELGVSRCMPPTDDLVRVASEFTP